MNINIQNNRDEIMFREMHNFIYAEIIEILKTSYDAFKKTFRDTYGPASFEVSDSILKVITDLYESKLSYSGDDTYLLFGKAPDYNQLLGTYDNILLFSGLSFKNRVYNKLFIYSNHYLVLPRSRFIKKPIIAINEGNW